MSSVWLDLTEPASATEKYKSKYEATTSHEFDVVQQEEILGYKLTSRFDEFIVV